MKLLCYNKENIQNVVISLKQLQILWVARSYAGPDSGVKPHTHPYYHMFYMVEGKCHFTAGGKCYDLNPGQFLLVPKETEHGYTNKETVQLELMEIKFSMPQSSLDKHLTQAGVQVASNALVDTLFPQILKEYSDLGNRADDAAESYLMSILHAVDEKRRYKKQSRFRYIDASNYSELSQKVVRFLEKHYAEDLSLDMLAEAMGHNKSYLCVAFKKNTQQTILDCLNTIRIRRAAELIVYSDHSLAQVAKLCGFSSVSHFNQVFLKYVGNTPGQCRRAYPVDVLFSKNGKTAEAFSRPNQFMYSVLAQKRIPIPGSKEE